MKGIIHTTPFCCQNYCWRCNKIKVAVSQIFDRVKFVALWSTNIRKLAKDHTVPQLVWNMPEFELILVAIGTTRSRPWWPPNITKIQQHSKKNPHKITNFHKNHDHSFCRRRLYQFYIYRFIFLSFPINIYLYTMY